MPIHSIWRCLNTLYTSNMDVGCSQWCLQPKPWHHSTFGLCLTPIFQNLAPTVYSLNHDTITSFGLHLNPIFQNLPPICTGIRVRVHSYATANEGNWTLCKLWIWMWDAVSGGLQPEPWHHSTFGLPLTPIFQNLLAPTCTGITL